MSEPIVAVDDLSVALPSGAERQWAVERIKLTIDRGEILCVVGESGSGKSVLANAIMGALPRGLRRKTGRVVFENADLTGLSERHLRRIRGRSMAMIFQEPMSALNPVVPVGAQIEEAFAIHAPHIPRVERRRRALRLLAETHMPDPGSLAKRYPHQLSGGQCQRVIIAMALAMQPALLIADEPTTALDVTTEAQILRLIRELRDSHGLGVLFITHDFGVVAEIADRIAVMKTGRIVEIGARADVLDQPKHPYTRELIEAVPSLIPPRRPPTKTGPSLAFRDLSKSYGAVRALNGITFDVPKGGTVAVVGESGSGKSTLAKIAVRLVDATAGSVLVDGLEFTTLSGRDLMRRRRAIQIVFQDPYGSLNPRRTMGDVLARAGILGGLTRASALQRSAELIKRVELGPDALSRKPQAFSGGQRQRLCIARALAINPTILIADESVSALDVSVQRQILELLQNLQRQTGLTLLFITHDLRVAAQIGDFIAVMRAGELVEYGPTSQILQHPREAYTAELIAAAPGKAWQAEHAAERGNSDNGAGQCGPLSRRLPCVADLEATGPADRDGAAKHGSSNWR